MAELTRRSLLAAVGVAATAGCLSDDRPGETTGETPRTESPERETTDSTATARGTPDETTAGDWVTHASNQPDPDHAVTLENRSDAAETVRVRVVREATDETAFEATETVDSGVELDLYNLKEASPEGVEAFEICGELVEAETSTADASTTDDALTTAETTTARTTTTRTTTTAPSGRRDCATIRTNECYADAHVTVGEDGALQVVYAIC
ncbi:hypothetical protein [Halorussus halobius]|uniref:hypothetical protein n=1 Tax=Halorussus halobius TaxID=1710537 RepID=UPI0010932F59|nr:hypothetical protein [Halorussus halobius]